MFFPRHERVNAKTDLLQLLLPLKNATNDVFRFRPGKSTYPRVRSGAMQS